MTRWFNMPNSETIKFLTIEPPNPFTAFIPKKTRAKEFGDFTPVSFIGNKYKVILKVLTERLKRVMDKMVDSQQMAFTKRRQVMDVDLITNEAVDSRIKQKKLGNLCKLDIEKAHDHIIGVSY